MRQGVWHRAAFLGATLAAGLAAFWLQSRALAVGYDAKGLYIRSTPAGLWLMAVCVVYGVGLLAGTMARIRTSADYGAVFDRCWFRGALMALGGGMLALDLGYALEPVPPILMILGLTAAACMAVTGMCVGKGRRPKPWFHGAVCVFAIVRLLILYRAGGANAHLEQFAFPLLAGVLVMLYSFHRCAADAQVVRPRHLVLTAGAGVVCSMAAMAGDADRVYNLAMICWILGSMCNVAKAQKEPVS